MANTNSPLATYKFIVKNKTVMTSKTVKRITIHHMAGNLSLPSCAAGFNGARKASSNYGIDTNGKIGLFVEEKDRAYTSSSSTNDKIAVTIEVANDEYGGQWHVSDKALASLIDLCVDICKRNGMKELTYTGNKNGSLTLHRMFAATACPGPYLYSKMPYIAAEVTRRLKGGAPTKLPTSTVTTKPTTNTNPILSTAVNKNYNYTLVFDATYYANKYPDLKAAFGNNKEALLNHFLRFGVEEGRIANTKFNINVYKNSNPDLVKAYSSLKKNIAYLNHYLICGYNEKRKTV